MSGSIDGGGFGSVDYSLYQGLGEVAEETGELVEERTDVNELLNAHTDSVEVAEQVAESDELAYFSSLEAGAPTLAPGKGGDVSDLFDADISNAGVVAKDLVSELPENLQMIIKAGLMGNSEEIEGLKQTIAKVANVSELSRSYLENVSQVKPKDLEKPPPTGPGPISATATANEANAQMKHNQLSVLKNQEGIITAHQDSMPAGPPKDSINAFLSAISDAIRNLEEFLANMDEGIAKSSEFDAAGAQDDYQITESKLDEYRKKKEEAENKGGILGAIFGDIFEALGLGDILDSITKLLDFGGLTSDLGDFVMELPIAGGLIESLGLGPLVKDPMAMALMTASLAAIVISGGALAPIVIPTMMTVTSNLACLSMYTGEPSFMRETMEGLPIVGGIVKQWLEMYSPMNDLIGTETIFARDDDKTGSSKGDKPRSRSRNAGTASVSSSAAAQVSKHVAEIDGEEQEQVDLKAQLQKLLSLLRKIASGDVSPDQIAGDLTARLGKIASSGDLTAVMGGDMAGGLRLAAQAGERGDTDMMVKNMLSAFGTSSEALSNTSAAARDVIPELGGSVSHHLSPLMQSV